MIKDIQVYSLNKITKVDSNLMKINLIEFEFNRNINISYIGTSHEIQNIIIYYYS